MHATSLAPFSFQPRSSLHRAWIRPLAGPRSQHQVGFATAPTASVVEVNPLVGAAFNSWMMARPPCMAAPYSAANVKVSRRASIMRRMSWTHLAHCGRAWRRLARRRPRGWPDLVVNWPELPEVLHCRKKPPVSKKRLRADRMAWRHNVDVYSLAGRQCLSTRSRKGVALRILPRRQCWGLGADCRTSRRNAAPHGLARLWIRPSPGGECGPHRVDQCRHAQIFAAAPAGRCRWSFLHARPGRESCASIGESRSFPRWWRYRLAPSRRFG